MIASGGDLVSCALYRDAAPTQCWGADVATGSNIVNGTDSANNPTSLSVHGHVPWHVRPERSRPTHTIPSAAGAG